VEEDFQEFQESRRGLAANPQSAVCEGCVYLRFFSTL
jgi:hypothetical protein